MAFKCLFAYKKTHLVFGSDFRIWFLQTCAFGFAVIIM